MSYSANVRIGGLMRLTKPFDIFNGSLGDLWRMHDFNYHLPEEAKHLYWDEECLVKPTQASCKLYEV